MYGHFPAYRHLPIYYNLYHNYKIIAGNSDVNKERYITMSKVKEILTIGEMI